MPWSPRERRFLEREGWLVSDDVINDVTVAAARSYDDRVRDVTATMHEMQHWDAAEKLDVIGDQPAVTAPPKALRAHDRRRLSRSNFEQFIARCVKFEGSHVRGVISKTRMTQREIR